MSPTLLLIEEAADAAAVVLDSLQKAGWQTARFGSRDGLHDYLRHHPTDLLLLALSSPPLPPDEVMQAAAHMRPEIPVILLGETQHEAEALHLMEKGARDFVKATCPAHLVAACRRELASAQLLAGLLENEARLQAVLDHAADGILGVDEQGLIRSLNPAAARMFGYDPSELLGQHLRVIIPRPYLREHDTYRNQSNPVTALGREVSGRQRDGRSIPLELSVGASASKQRLFVAIVRDVSQRKESEVALEDSRQQLRSLAARLQNIREDERTRISREVHDELGQALTGVKMDLAWLLSKMTDEPLRRRAASGIELIDQTIQTVRKIASELRPAVLDNLGLVAAIEWQAHEFHLRTGIVCACALELEQPELASDVSTTLFRIFQETLTNVMRHAQATRVEVSLRQQDQEICLEVNDNGRGITTEQQAGSGSLGLLGMRERAQQLGGHFSIQGIPGLGTSVRLRVPLRLAPVPSNPAL